MKTILSCLSRRRRGFLAALLLAGVAFAAEVTAPADQPAATARGVVITVGRVEKLMKGPYQFRTFFNRASTLPAVKRAAATDVCAGELFLQTLTEPVRLELSEKVAGEFRDWRNSVPNEQAFAEAVAKTGETVEDGKWRRLRYLATERFLKDRMPALPEPSEAVLEALYRDPERRRGFIVPEERQVRWLRVEFPFDAEPAVVRASRERCEKLRSLAGAEGLNAKLAETPGEPSAEFGKSLEQIWDEELLDDEEHIHWPVISAAKTTAKGAISPVTFNEWERYHFVVQVDGVTAGRVVPYAEARPGLLAEVKAKSEKQAREEFIQAQLAAADFKLLLP